MTTEMRQRLQRYAGADANRAATVAVHKLACAKSAAASRASAAEDAGPARIDIAAIIAARLAETTV